jgi:hypothetical protein
VQKLAKRLDFHGLDIRVEYPKGAKRSFQDDKGKTQYKTMRADYGEVRGTEGLDGDPVDVYVGPHKDADRVFVITQMKKGDWSKIDEEKCILGVRSRDEAARLYLAHYDDSRFLGSIKEFSMKQFQDRLETRGVVGQKIASSAERIAELNYMRLQQGLPVLVDHQHGVKTSALDADDKENLRHLGRAATNPLVVGGAAGVGTGLAMKNAPRAGRVGAGALAGIGAHQVAKKLHEGVREVRDYRARRALERAYGGEMDGYKSSAYEPWSPEIERAREEQRKHAAATKVDPDWDKDIPDDAERKLKRYAPERYEDMRRSALPTAEVTKQEQLGIGIKERDVKDNPKDSKMRKAAQLAQVELFIKSASDGLTDRQQRIANTVDNVGIGVLASPYIGAGLEKHLGKRPGVLGAIGQAGGRYAKRFSDQNRKEIAGLALVSHAGMNTTAKGIDKLLPSENKIDRAKLVAKTAMLQKQALSFGNVSSLANAAVQGIKGVAGRVAGRGAARAAGNAAAGQTAGRAAGSLAQATAPAAESAVAKSVTQAAPKQWSKGVSAPGSVVNQPAQAAAQAAPAAASTAPKSSVVIGKDTGAPAHANSPAAQRARAQLAAQQQAAPAAAAAPAHAGTLSTAPGASIGPAAHAPAPSMAPGSMTIPPPPRVPTNVGTIPPPPSAVSLPPPAPAGAAATIPSPPPAGMTTPPAARAASVPPAAAAPASAPTPAAAATVPPPAASPSAMPAASTPASTPVAPANQRGLKLEGADAVEGRPGTIAPNAPAPAGAPVDAAAGGAPAVTTTPAGHKVVQVKGQTVLADDKGMPIVDAKGNYVSPEMTRGEKALNIAGKGARGLRNAAALGVGAVGLGLGAGGMGAAHILGAGGHGGVGVPGYAPPNG